MINGLDDVVVAETVLSDVDGQAGRLVIRGHSLDDLVANATYERVVTLLWEGFFDGLPGVDSLAELLGAARLEAFQHLESLDEHLLNQPLFDVVRALMARIEDGAGLGNALLLVAAFAVFTPAVIRLQRGMEPIPPDPTRTHTEDLLRMLRGKPVPNEQAKALDRYLITACDHGLNASTFVARIVASTRAGQTSAVVAAMGALKGPLHGGAPGPVLDMLDEIGTSDRAGSWLPANYLVRNHSFDLGRVSFTDQHRFTELLLTLVGLRGQDVAQMRVPTLYLSCASFLEALGGAFVGLKFRHKSSNCKVVNRQLLL